MKRFYVFVFFLAALLIGAGAYWKINAPDPSLGSELLLSGGLLLAFAAFSGSLLDGKEGWENA